jgi:hypothetical protein
LAAHVGATRAKLSRRIVSDVPFNRHRSVKARAKRRGCIPMDSTETMDAEQQVPVLAFDQLAGRYRLRTVETGARTHNRYSRMTRPGVSDEDRAAR